MIRFDQILGKRTHKYLGTGVKTAKYFLANTGFGFPVEQLMLNMLKLWHHLLPNFMLKLFIQALTDDCIQLILLIKSLLNQPQVIWIKGLPTRPQHISLQAAPSTHQSQHSFHHKTFSFHQNRCPIQAALNLHYLLKINNKLTAQSLNCYHYCICPRNG